MNVRKTVSTNAPIVGLQALWQLTPSLTLRVKGDYGGFNVDHMHETYNAEGVLTYHFQWGKRHAKALAGYRYVYLDLKDDRVEIDVKVKGPLLGIGFDF